MAKVLQGLKRVISSDLRQQFIDPTNSLFGYACTKYWELQNRELVKRVVSTLNLNSDSNVLEVGFGRGYGLELCHLITQEGKGKGRVYGIEASRYMLDAAHDRFFAEIREQKSMAVEAVPILYNMPYPNNFFDAIYHVDAFYFWNPERMRETCREFFRILKPSGILVCGMELNRLKRLEKFGILNSIQFDPMQYMIHLEPAGFKNVKIEYEKLDSSNREIQLIRSEKPTQTEEASNYDMKMQSLELDIKNYLMMQSLAETPGNVENIDKKTEKGFEERGAKTAKN